MTQFITLPGYHWFAFQRLHELYHEETRHVLIHKYADLRKRLFLEYFNPNEIVEYETAWERTKEILDILESEMHVVISVRSVTYWTHLYRRLGVMLSPDHESNTDPHTVGLVRQIAELAIQSHGLLEAEEEFGKTDKLSPNIILGGWMIKGMRRLENAKDVIRKHNEMLRSNPTWVVRKFSKKDFISLYAIEGIAYQYWRLTALLRSLGKGSSIIIDQSGDWEYVEDADFEQLIRSVDNRNLNTNSFSSLMGVWIDEETILGRNAQNSDKLEDSVFIPVYNTSRTKLPEDFEIFGVPIRQPSETNFLPIIISAGAFFEHHEFMRKEFIQKRGYDFKLIVSVLAAYSSLAIIPSRALHAEDEEEKLTVELSAFIQSLTRGYHVYEGTVDNLLNILIDRMAFMFQTEFDRIEVAEVVSSITLTKEIQEKIALWSNGPRSIVIPSDDFHLVDLASVPALLSSIFVFMSDKFGDSGTVFEELFKQALIRRGFDVKCGDLYTVDGSTRELDAGVVVNRRMYLFECVSIERPLDYEIGKPKTLAGRKKRLIEKIDQAKTLKSFLTKHPAGRNFDFSHVTEFEWIVVSPFVEWIWSKDVDLWLDEEFPRILAPEEVFNLLEVDGSD